LYIYVQVTRGAEHGRNHAPLPDVARTVFAFASPWPEGRAGWRENGLPAVTAQDTRWARCDIKSVSLLANVLLRQLAVDANGAATREVQPVSVLDGRPVGTGKAGPVWRKLYDAYQAYKRELAGSPW